MSRHVHLPPILPYVAPSPLEKKEKTRRKSAIQTDKTEDEADIKTEQVDAPKPPPPPPAVHNPSPLSRSGSQLAVLLDAQEEAQPASAGVPRKPEDFI